MVIMENIPPYATSNVGEGILIGDQVTPPPAPLLANLGAVNLLCYNVDMHVSACYPSLQSDLVIDVRLMGIITVDVVGMQ